MSVETIPAVTLFIAGAICLAIGAFISGWAACVIWLLKDRFNSLAKPTTQEIIDATILAFASDYATKTREAIQ